MDDGEPAPAAPTPPRPVTIHNMDLVKFKPINGAHGDRGVAFPTAGEPSVRVLCADGTVVTREHGDLTVVDRGGHIDRGRVVASLSDPGGQVGVVTGVATEVDLIQLNGGGEGEPAAVVARGVSPGELRRVRELCYGDFVVSGPWLGVVVRVFLAVDVEFDDGAVCRVGGGRKIKAKTDGYSYVAAVNSPYYPGQRVVVAGAGDDQPSSSTLEACQWLKGCWNPSRVEGTVSKVASAGALVYWVASAQLGADRRRVRESAPFPYQKDIGSLTFFYSDAAWAVASRCFFRDGGVHGHGGAGGDRRGHAAAAEEELEQRCVCVADVRTAVDVVWQDGTRRRGVPSASLEPAPPLNDHDFLPGERVVADVDGDGEVRVGVVRSADCDDHTVRVSWLKPSSSSSSPVCEVECEETVSAYGLRIDCGIFYGDVVVRLPPSPESSGGGSNGGAPAQDSTGVAAPPAAAAATAKDDLSWVGNVVDLCDDGYVLVRWGDGNTTKVLHHEIAAIRRQHVDELEAELDRELLERKRELEKKAQERAAADGASTTLIECQTNNNREDDSNSTDGSGGQGDDGGSGDDDEGDSTEEVKVDVIAGCSEDLLRFVQFDVVQSPPPDHHYLNDTQQGALVGRKWTKRVHNEWKILKNNLPETIYVRAFEDRMDLLRAAMVGAVGTPYQDGLFFFDLQLPPSFPAVPPQVYYRSFGLCLNPNLDKSGTVCLSLLGTFDGGEGTELWSPANSTVLQVLVSIQGLVLNAEPYYNEAGYEELHGRPEGARNALPYAENACLLTLRTMLHLLRRPPAGFEALVEGRAPERSSDDSEQRCSKGFRLALAGVMPQLVEAFAKIGAEGCEQF